MASSDLIGLRRFMGSDKFVSGADNGYFWKGRNLEMCVSARGCDGEFGGVELSACRYENFPFWAIASHTVDVLIDFGSVVVLNAGESLICFFVDGYFFNGDNAVTAIWENSSGHYLDTGIG